jgi:cyclopropane fatty-acyl-phospholipid synthase-like methyltransferase
MSSTSWVEPDPDSTALFRTAWAAYEAVVRGDWMQHRELERLVTGWLDRVRPSGPLRLLDLGCGDAVCLRNWLRRRPDVHYTGVDVADAVLDQARGALAGVERVTLVAAPMQEFVRTCPASHDVVFSSYALHHLATEAKRAFLRDVRGCLAPGGVLVLVDAFRREDETRDEAVAAYVDMMRTKWTGLGSEHLALACEHVAAHDFPETVGGVKALAREAGWVVRDSVAVHERHHALLFAGQP